MLSIRTQNRMALVPYDDTIKLYEYSDNYYIQTKGRDLGTYATKGRALEVLNSIQASVELEDLVYQMPIE